MKTKTFAFSLATALTFTSTPAAFAEDPPSIPRPPEVIMLGYTTDGNPIYGPAPSMEGLPVPMPGISNLDNRPSYTYTFADGSTMSIPAGQDINGNFIPVPPPIGLSLIHI